MAIPLVRPLSGKHLFSVVSGAEVTAGRSKWISNSESTAVTKELWHCESLFLLLVQSYCSNSSKSINWIRYFTTPLVSW